MLGQHASHCTGLVYENELNPKAITYLDSLLVYITLYCVNHFIYCKNVLLVTMCLGVVELCSTWMTYLTTCMTKLFWNTLICGLYKTISNCDTYSITIIV